MDRALKCPFWLSFSTLCSIGTEFLPANYVLVFAFTESETCLFAKVIPFLPLSCVITKVRYRCLQNYNNKLLLVPLIEAYRILDQIVIWKEGWEMESLVNSTVWILRVGFKLWECNLRTVEQCSPGFVCRLFMKKCFRSCLAPLLSIA